MIAWHFTGNTLRDGSPIPKVGEPFIYTGEVVICKSGLHASKEPFDALRYAPGPILHKVECENIVIEQKDKFVCQKRTIIKSLDATEGLLYFARMQALSVVHLWDAPDAILDYLMTGNAANAAVNSAYATNASYATNAAYAAYAANAAVNSAHAAAYAAYASANAAYAAYPADRAVANAAARAEFNFLVMEAFE